MNNYIITNDETWSLVLFHADNDPKIVRDIDRILIDAELSQQNFSSVEGNEK